MILPLLMMLVFGRAVPDHHFVVGGKAGATTAVAADEQYVVGALAGEATVVFGRRGRR